VFRRWATELKCSRVVVVEEGQQAAVIIK